MLLDIVSLFAREPVGHDDPADLLDLIRLGLTTTRLEVEDLRNAVPREDVVVAAGTLGESQVVQQDTEVVESYACVGRAAEDAISDLLDQAAAVLADASTYPIFFHCHHGLNRTSMVQIAYRTKYCGWNLTQAADEIERSVGLVKVNHGPDYRHMVSFYENRVLPLREQRSSRSADKQPSITARLEKPDSATSKQ